MVEYAQSAYSWMTNLPWQAVGKVVLSLAAPSAAVFVAYKFGRIQAEIGRQQAETAALAMGTARNKLRLDLFDKREAVYNATARALKIAQARGGPLADDEYLEFSRAIQPARWLFSNDAASLLLTHIPSELLALHGSRYYEPGEKAGAGDGRRDKLDVLEILHKYENELARLMVPYLRFEERSQNQLQ